MVLLSIESPTHMKPDIRRKWLRRSLFALAGGIVFLGVLIAFLPTILSGSFGRNMAVGFVSPLVRGQVSLASLSLSWSGPQVIQGFSIKGADGASITVDVTAQNGLIALARQSEPPHIVLSGIVATTYRPDGSLSLTELFVSPTPAVSQPAKATPAPAPSVSLAETLRGTILEITSLQLIAAGSQSDPKIEINGLKGKFSVEDAGVRATFSAATKVGEKTGSLSLNGMVGGLFAKDGSVNMDAASIDVDLQASALAIPSAGVPLEIESLSIKITSAKFADAVRVSGNTVIQLPTGETANSTISLDATNPMDAAKRSLAGSISLVNLPTSALAPYLPAPLNAARDLGSSLNAKITLEGRTGSAEISSQKFSITAAGGLAEDGNLVTIDRLAVSAQIDPALLPPTLGVSAPVAVSIQGSAISLPIPAKNAAMAWKDARMNTSVTIAPIAMKISPTMLFAVGATTILLESSDPTKSITLKVQSSVDGSAIAIDQVITGLVNAQGLAVDAATAKGRVQLSPMMLADAPWLDASMRLMLADAAITNVAAQIENDGGKQGGNASVTLGLSATSIATKITWTKSGFSTQPIDCSLIVPPSVVDRYAGPAVVLASPTRVAVQIAAMTGTWDSVSAGQFLPATISTKITTDAIDLSAAPGLTHGGRLQGFSASATLSTRADGSIGGVDAQLGLKLMQMPTATNPGRDAATIAATVRLSDVASAVFQSTFDVAISQGDTLATMIDAGEGSAALVGPGTVKGSFNRELTKDAFTADISLPRLALKSSGTLTPGKVAADGKGAPTAAQIDIAKTTASFDVPAEIVEQALGLRTGVDWRTLVAQTGGRSIIGSIDIESCRWTGRAEDASVVMNVVVEPGSIAPPNRAAIAFEKITMSVKSPRLAERAQASIAGKFKVGSGSAGNLSLALDANGDLRSLLGASSDGKDHPLALKASTLSIKIPGALAIALADWNGGSDALSKSITQLGDINAAFNINSLSLPTGAATSGAVDLRMDLAAIAIEPAGKPKLSMGAIAFTMKSAGFDRELNAGLNGTFQVGDSAPGPISLGIAASGDLRSLFAGGASAGAVGGAVATPLTLQASEMQIKIPGALALSLVDWMNGTKDASAALTRLGSIDLSAHIKSLIMPASGMLNGSCDLSLDLAAIEVEPKGKPIVALGATRAEIKSPRLSDSMTLSLTSGGAKTGSITAQASGQKLSNAAGVFDVLAGAWTAQVRCLKIPTAIVDAAAGQGGQMVEALGPEIDASVDANVVIAPNGIQTTVVKADLKTQYLSVVAPKVDIASGMVFITAANPLAVTFTINKVLQRRLLEPMNPVLADIRKAPPIRLQVSQAAYPLDGQLAKLDLDARVDVGDVEVVRSNQFLGMLALAQDAKSDTIPALIEPLVVTVRKGSLTYKDFIVKAGKFGDQWQQVLKLSGDINLGKTPPYANAITCRYPLSSLGRSIGGASGSLSTTAQQLSEAIKKLPIDPGDLVQVDITLSGPLGDVDGKPVPLQSQVKMVFDASALDAKRIGKGVGDLIKMFGK